MMSRGYENGTKAIFEASVNTERYLLTFEYANHNAGAPMPPPAESWKPSEHIDFIPFDHYADPVWDSVRMKQHHPALCDRVLRPVSEERQ